MLMMVVVTLLGMFVTMVFCAVGGMIVHMHVSEILCLLIERIYFSPMHNLPNDLEPHAHTGNKRQIVHFLSFISRNIRRVSKQPRP